MTLTRAVAAFLVVALIGVGIYALREATMSSDTQVRTGTTEVVISVRKQREPRFTLAEVAEVVVDRCRLAVDAELRSGLRRVGEGERLFAFRLRPALNRSDQLELRGCLEDTAVEHVLVGVLELTTRPQ